MGSEDVTAIPSGFFLSVGWGIGGSSLRLVWVDRSPSKEGPGGPVGEGVGASWWWQGLLLASVTCQADVPDRAGPGYLQYPPSLCSEGVENKAPLSALGNCQDLGVGGI